MLAIDPISYIVAGLSRQALVGQDAKACTSMLFTMLRLQRSRKRDVFPGARPVSIERSQIPQLRSMPYWVAQKTDGERFMLMAVVYKNLRLCLLINRSMRMFVLEAELPTTSFQNSLLDGELYFAHNVWNFAVFDAIYLAGIDLASHPFSVRLDLVRAWREDMNKGICNIHLHVKQFALVGRDRIHKNDMPCDGLIFVPEQLPYGCYRNDTLFKWKNNGQHTVDFQVQNKKLMTISQKKLVEVAAVHQDDQHAAQEGTVVECQHCNGLWRIIKTRPDKDIPNDTYVLTKTVLNIQENIQLNEFDV